MGLTGVSNSGKKNGNATWRSQVEGSVPCPGQPELAYEGEKFSSRDRFRPC